MPFMTVEDIRHLATLARIKLSDEEERAYAMDADSILGYIDHIRQLALGDREPKVYPEANPLRDDVVTDEPMRYVAAIHDAFPKKSGDHLLVKRILTQGE
jgi:aspartyl/glutamyl-tRNA(Asn/Gln) amidotransferase C subunit